MPTRRNAPKMDDEFDHDSVELSQLPEEVLVSVLSYLPLKDAAATSKLAKGWRYLWRQTSRLDFNDNKGMNNIEMQPRMRIRERNKYINWVNRVIRHHTNSILEEFKICFDLDKSSKVAITKWIEFALSKNVQKLELDLGGNDDALRNATRNFVFPNKILARKSRALFKRQSLNVPRMPSSKAMEMKLLKVLTLKSVNVNDEALGKILTSSPVLEHLCIHNSGDLVNVKISGQKLKLLNLEIQYCTGIESIYISDSNLAWFHYMGSETDIKFNNVPRLYKLTMREAYPGIENKVFQQISSCFPCLQELELEVGRPQPNMQRLLSVPELPAVKQLSLSVEAWEDDSLLELTWLVKACPNVERLMIQMIWVSPTTAIREFRNDGIKHPYQHLELLVIAGYHARTSDLELIEYFIENGVALKRIVIDPSYQVKSRRPLSSALLWQAERGRAFAHYNLESKMPPGVRLIVL